MAETYAARALAERRHALGPEHPDTMASAADRESLTKITGIARVAGSLFKLWQTP